MLELVVVLAIVGILATMAVTTYISYLPHLRLNNESRKFAMDLLMARQLAVKENRIFYTCLTIASEKYDIYRLTASAEDGAPCDGSGNEQLYKSYTFDTGVDLDAAYKADGTTFTRVYSCPDGLAALVSNCPDTSTSFPLRINVKVSGGPDPENRLVSIRLSGSVTVK